MGKNIILKTLLGLIVLCMPLAASSQILKSVGIVKSHSDDKANTVAVQRKKGKPKKSYGNTKGRRKVTVSSKSDADTIYSIYTKKQHGWFMPLDTISKEFASHRNLSFRFTKKYPSGYWGKMEAINGYGHLTSSNMAPYILKISSADTDENANKEWVEKLKTCCIYEFVADPTGKAIIQERAYDKDMNLVYTYSRVPSGKGVYIGSYKDSNGLPAEMRKEPSYSYGTLVRLTEDQWGNDSIVEYIDSKGKAKPNSDGAAMAVFTSDNLGHVLKNQSKNTQGNLIKDNWGNCGVEVVYNDKHQQVEATFMDEYWKPMKLPRKRGNDVGNRGGVIRMKFKYDDYGRDVEEAYFTENDVETTNDEGIHRIKLEFNDKGDVVSQMNIGLNGELVNDYGGMAQYIAEYDSLGRIVRSKMLDKDGLPRRHPTYLSKFDNKYDSQGNLVKREEYINNNGKEHLSYKQVNKKNMVLYLWEDGVTRVDTLDNQGRTLCVTYRDSLGNLSDKDNHYAIHRFKYNDSPKKTIVTESYYDKNQKLCDSEYFAWRKMVVDTISKTRTTVFNWQYNKKNELTDTFFKYMKKSENDDYILGQGDANAFGIICRAGGNAEVRYYKCDVETSISNDKFSTFVGRDEFGEPDYISSPYAIYYYMKFSKGMSLMMDENSNVISDHNIFKDQCPKALTIEVVDSMAYRLGLRDNDVILMDGSYVNEAFVNDSSRLKLDDFRKNWTLHSVLNASKSRSIVVFRVNAKTLDYGLVKIDGLKGTSSELGYLVHTRYLTQKQLKRIQNCVLANIASEMPLVKREDFKPKDYSGNHYVILAFADLSRKVRNMPYPKNITDPSVLLGVCCKDRRLSLILDNNDAFMKETEMISTRRDNSICNPRLDFFVTKNGKTINHLALDEQFMGTYFFDASISDECYEQLKNMYALAKDSIESILKEKETIPAKRYVGIWKSKSSSNKIYIPEPEIYINLMKTGKMQGIITNYGEINYKEGTAIYKLERKIEGTWRHGGKWLFFYPVQADTTLCCLNMDGMENGEKKNSILSYQNVICKTEPEKLLKEMSFPYGKIGNDLLVTYLDKKEMSVNSFITLERTEEKPSVEIKQAAEKTETDVTMDVSSLLGYWKADVPDMLNSTEEFCFKENGEFCMDFHIRIDSVKKSSPYTVCLDLGFKGKWMPNGKGISLKVSSEFDSDINIETDCSDMKFREDLEHEMKSQWGQYIKEAGVRLANDSTLFSDEIAFEVIDSTRINFGGQVLTKMANTKGVILGEINLDDAYLAKMGFSGKYAVLQWCNWSCTQTVDEFSEELAKQKDNEKNLVLLPVSSVNNRDEFGKVIKIHCPKDLLGMKLVDVNVSYDYFKTQILSRYENFKRNKR